MICVLFVADFQSIPNRQKIHSIATYLCQKPYSKNNFWFGKKPCYHIGIPLKIYEWYHNIPAVQWPTGYLNLMNMIVLC